MKPIGVLVAVVLLLIGCQKAASRVHCYSGEACRPGSQLQDGLQTSEGCCSSFPNTLKSYNPTGSEDCLKCGSHTYYGCFVAECGDSDLMINVPDSENTTYAMNDGERVCCSSGQYRSWTSDTHNQGTCNLCPIPVSTTVNISQSTKTTLPKARPQNPTSNNGNVENHLEPTGATVTIINDNDLPIISNNITVLVVVLVCSLVLLTVIVVSVVIVMCFILKKNKRKALDLKEHIYDSVSVLAPSTQAIVSKLVKLTDNDDEAKEPSVPQKFELTDNVAYGFYKPHVSS